MPLPSTSTAVPGTVQQFSFFPGYVDKSGNTSNGSNGAGIAWAAQGAGGTLANGVANNGTNWLQTANLAIDPFSSEGLLFTNFSWSPTIPLGATITGGILTIAKVSSVTGAGRDVYDLVAQYWIYNGTDLSSGALGTNLAATPLAWSQTATPGPGAGTSFGYTTSSLTYAQVTNANFGFLFAADGSQVTNNTKAEINSVSMSVTWTASSPGSYPGALISVPFCVAGALALPALSRVLCCQSKKLVLPKRFQVDRPARILVF
jgi:hypothetical protein